MGQALNDKRINELKTFLRKVNIDSDKLALQDKHLDIINEALTHTSAQAQKNHERLEFIGDAVLRLAATEFVKKYFPNMKVGEMSELRAHLVSDRWLATVGSNIEIESIIITGKKASKDKSASATLKAETTEALIGAIYNCLDSLIPIHNWLTPYWLKTSEKILSDPYKENSKSALQEWSQAKCYELPRYEITEYIKKHGDPKRFFCKVFIKDKKIGEGWGGSIKDAEKEAAKFALNKLK